MQFTHTNTHSHSPTLELCWAIIWQPAEVFCQKFKSRFHHRVVVRHHCRWWIKCLVQNNHRAKLYAAKENVFIENFKWNLIIPCTKNLNCMHSYLIEKLVLKSSCENLFGFYIRETWFTIIRADKLNKCGMLSRMLTWKRLWKSFFNYNSLPFFHIHKI